MVTLREGNTPLLDAPRAAATGAWIAWFQTPGLQSHRLLQRQRNDLRRGPGASPGHDARGLRLHRQHFGFDGGLRRAAGLEPVIFIPHGNISFGKLAQALEYGARTFQSKPTSTRSSRWCALAERLGIYLLNSINPFRIEGQKTIMTEMLDQRDWRVPDWVVLPGGNLGNISAFGKGLREMRDARPDRSFAAPGRDPGRRRRHRFTTLRAGGSLALQRGESSRDAGDRHQNRRSGFVAQGAARGCSPRAAWWKGHRAGDRRRQSRDRALRYRLRAGFGRHSGGYTQADGGGHHRADADVVAVLTGNVLKDPDYIYRYHLGELQDPEGKAIISNFGNPPVIVPNDEEKIARAVER